jgi:hypothetical protein
LFWITIERIGRYLADLTVVRNRGNGSIDGGEWIVTTLDSAMARHGGKCSLTLRLNAKSNHISIASSLNNIQRTGDGRVIAFVVA